VNPRLGRGSVTNQEAPEANATAEWKTTSPAITNPRIMSNSGRRPAERPDNDCPAAVRAAAGAGIGWPAGAGSASSNWLMPGAVIGLTSPWTPAAGAVDGAVGGAAGQADLAGHAGDVDNRAAHRRAAGGVPAVHHDLGATPAELLGRCPADA
jgi:hypothetical protein